MTSDDNVVVLSTKVVELSVSSTFSATVPFVIEVDVAVEEVGFNMLLNADTSSSVYPADLFQFFFAFDKSKVGG